MVMLSRHTLKHPTFAWSVIDKYRGLKDFHMTVKNIFMTYNYYVSNND